MSDGPRGVYPPLNVLKCVAANVWIVDGPIIRFGPRWFAAPFPTRMTIVRLDGDRLFIHSPTPLTAALRDDVMAVGKVAWIVGPNRLHYSWIPEWRAGFPAASIYLAPHISEQARGRIAFDFLPLESEHGFPWDDAIATLPVRGSYMTEVVFFHRSSRTLIVTDLIENFEPYKIDSRLLRWLTRLGGVQDPDGQTPRDLRLTFRKDRLALRVAVERMIAWSPQRIILAHGRWYAENGAQELRRAFRWALRD
jgi:hypothetical protein